MPHQQVNPRESGASRALPRRRRDERGEATFPGMIRVAIPLTVGMVMAAAALVHQDVPAWLALLVVFGPPAACGLFLVVGGALVVVMEAAAESRRDERGVFSVFVVLFVAALLAVAGLVIDGGYACGGGLVE